MVEAKRIVLQRDGMEYLGARNGGQRARDRGMSKGRKRKHASEG